MTYYIVTCDFDQTLIDSNARVIEKDDAYDFIEFQKPIDVRNIAVNKKLITFLRHLIRVAHMPDSELLGSYIVTNRANTKYVEQCLQDLHIDDLFDEIIGNDTPDRIVDKNTYKNLNVDGTKVLKIVNLVQSACSLVKSLRVSHQADDRLVFYMFDDNDFVCKRVQTLLKGSEDFLTMHIISSLDIWSPPSLSTQ